MSDRDKDKFFYEVRDQNVRDFFEMLVSGPRWLIEEYVKWLDETAVPTVIEVLDGLSQPDTRPQSIAQAVTELTTAWEEDAKRKARGEPSRLRSAPPLESRPLISNFWREERQVPTERRTGRPPFMGGPFEDSAGARMYKTEIEGYDPRAFTRKDPPLVSAVQKRINELFPRMQITTTGEYDQKTGAVIKTLQRRFGLEPDGEITDEFIRALQ